jgi:hypothetical protein
MRTRLVAAALAVVLFASFTRPALADGTPPILQREASLVELVRPAPQLSLTSTEAFGLTAPRVTSRLPLAPEEIRLSRGAKTAIIVSAIVVGALIIVGLVVVAKPHKLP